MSNTKEKTATAEAVASTDMVSRHIRVMGFNGCYWLKLKIGSQSFAIGREVETKGEADWLKGQLAIALTKLISTKTLELRDRIATHINQERNDRP